MLIVRRTLATAVTLMACAIALGHAPTVSATPRAAIAPAAEVTTIDLQPRPDQVALLILEEQGILHGPPVWVEPTQDGMHAACGGEWVDGEMQGCVVADGTIVLYAPLLTNAQSGHARALIAHESAHLALREAGHPYPAPELSGLAAGTAQPGVNGEEAAVSCLGPFPTAYRDIECTPAERIAVAAVLGQLTGAPAFKWWAAGLDAPHEPMALTAPQQALVDSWRRAAGVE